MKIMSNCLKTMSPAGFMEPITFKPKNLCNLSIIDHSSRKVFHVAQPKMKTNLIHNKNGPGGKV